MSDTAAPTPGTHRPIPEDALPILPVRQVVLFPGTLQPLAVGRPRSQASVQEAVRVERPVGLLLRRSEPRSAIAEQCFDEARVLFQAN